MWSLHSVLLLLMVAVCLRYTAVGETQPFVSPPNSDLDSFHTFTSPDTSNYKTLTLESASQTLLIGARDRVFGQRLDDITKETFSPVLWPVSEIDFCTTLPQSDGGKKCYNQIQIVQRFNNTHLFICGSNSFTPQNKFFVSEDGGKTYSSIKDVTISNPLCSFDPDDSVISLVVNSGSKGPDIFSTARPELMSKISPVKMMPESLLLSTDEMLGEASTFVSSFTAADHANSGAMSKVYLVSGEKSTESEISVPTPTITQVCANDVGGQNLLSNSWSSLLKVRLSCKTTEEYPLTFDLITDMAPGRNGIIYGTFMTRHDTSRLNAVCSFRMEDVQNAFNNSKFWDTQSKPYRKVDAPTGVPRPGTCASEGSSSKNLSSKLLNFMSTHNLVTDVVQTAYPPTGSKSKTATSRDPLLIKPGAKFTKIAVEQVTGMDGKTYDLVFVGKSNGQILKFVSIEKDDVIETIELAQYQPTTQPIDSMKLSQDLGQLYIGTNERVHQLSTSNCEAYTLSCEFCDRCRMCVLSRDPGCAWDAGAKRCVSVKSVGKDNSPLQDVYHGNAQTQCGDYQTAKPTLVPVADGAKETFGHIISNPSITVLWFKVKDASTKERITNKIEKYRITTDGQLEIANFDTSTDAAMYESQYTTGTTILNVSQYDVQRSTYVPGPMSPAVPAVSSRSGHGIESTGDPDGAGNWETTIAVPLAVAFLSLWAVALAAALCLIVVAVFVLFCVCRRKKRKFKPRTNKHESASLRTENNTTNNNNSARARSENNDRASTPLLLPRQDHFADVVDGAHEITFIDEEATPSERPVRQSSLREASGRKRIPPARTKSMPGSAIYLMLDGKKLKCNTLQRNKKGTWTIEVQPNQSVLTDVAPEDNEIIDIINDDTVDGKEIFFPSPDEKSSNPQAVVTRAAEKAFSDGDNHRPGSSGSLDCRVQYMATAPDSVSIVSRPKIAPKAPHLAMLDGKKQLPTETERQACMQDSMTEDHDSDSTVRGSSLSPEPGGTPSSTSSTITPANAFGTPRTHYHNQDGVLTEVPTKEPTSDVPDLVASSAVNGETPVLTSSAKSLDRSSRSSDADEQLHGRDKHNTRNRPSTLMDSPSKQSRTSQGSSSSGDYKSARSSVVSEPSHEQR